MQHPPDGRIRNPDINAAIPHISTGIALYKIRRLEFLTHVLLCVHDEGSAVEQCLVQVGKEGVAGSLPPWVTTATAGSDVVQSGRQIFEDFFQHLRPYIGNNTANVVFQMVKRLWLIRIDQ
ncbi:hypothetical protein TNCV_2319711 [Trichonephila clavipes]|nr:hypothetical protein TNCV_2319711 [Trichonephila clavipes]